MKPYYDDGQVSILHGDARDLDGLSADVVVTDPPYGLAFMGKAWDRVDQGFHQEWATAAFQALPPGGWLLAFGGTRTWHRLACGIEDAGFEVRDTIAEFGPLAWVYGQGFPKSLDVGKAIDRQRKDNPDWQRVGAWLRIQRQRAGLSAKAACEAIGAHGAVNHGGAVSNWENGFSCPTWDQWLQLKALLVFGDEMDAEVWRLNGRKGTPGEAWYRREVLETRHDPGGRSVPILGVEAQDYDVTAPATPEAERWQGWGTALKPAWEPILVARKPLAGTVAQNVLEHGTGALNIDACRIGTEAVKTDHTAFLRFGGQNGRPWQEGHESHVTMHAGRWPPNVALVHGEGCQPVGVRKVRGSGSVTGKEPSGPWPQLGDFSPRQPFEAYADPDGTETVEAWECEEDSCPVYLLDQQSADLPGGGGPSKRPYLGNKDGSIYGKRGDGVMVGYPDKGGASRFFYTAKAGRSERITVDGEQHPTVKPLALMRWLVRLVTPPGGTVLDPFCGSGSTLVAARMEGFRAIGIEADERWCEGSAMRLREHEQGQGVLDLSG